MQHLIYDHLSEGILMIGSDNRITLVNKQCEELLNISRDECLGKDIDEFFQYPNEEMRYVQNALKERREIFLREALLKWERCDKHVKIETKILREKNKIVGAMAILSDVTQQELVKREDELESENVSLQLHSFFEQANDAILLLKVNEENKATYVDANQSALKMLEYTKLEFLKLDQESFIPSDFIRHSRGNERAIRKELIWYSKFRKRIPVETTVNFLSRKDGTLVIVRARDLTNEKRMENDLHYEMKYRSVICEHFNEGILIVENDVVKYVNSCFFKLLDEPVNCNAVINKPLNELIMKYDDSIKHPKNNTERIEEIIRDREKVTSEEMRLVNGKVLERDFIPIFIQDVYKGHIWVFRDRTTRRRLEQSLITSKVEAEKANIAKTKFLSHMSHELRTPLNSILGFAQLIESDEFQPVKGKQKKRIKKILNSGRYLLELINNILEFTRLESNKIDLKNEEVSINNVLNEAIQFVKQQVEDDYGNVKFYRISGEDIQIICDPFKLRHIFINLLMNAVKYNKRNGTVITRISQKGSEVEIAIQDEGIGIPKEEITSIFQPFYRMKKNELIEGTGIGLSVVKQLVKCLKGDLQVYSEEDVGTTFIVKLEASVKMEQRAQMKRSNKRKKVLYIEDNFSNIECMIDLFDEEKTDLMYALSGKEGMATAMDECPELILLDSKLPDIDGFELLADLKASSVTKHIPVIVLSALNDDTIKQKVMQNGAFDYIKKPINLAVLQNSVKNLL